MALDFPANPSDGEVFGSYVWSGSKGVWQSREESAAPAVVSPLPPESASPGDIWVDSSDGISYVYYNDGSSSQWIEMISSGVPSLETKADKIYVDSQDSLKANIVSPTFSGTLNAESISASQRVTGTTPNNSGSTGGVAIKAPNGGSQTSAYLQFVNNSYTSQYAAIEANPSGVMSLSASQVRIPNQPSFLATKSDNGNTYSGDYVFNIALHNTGGHYSTSNGRFTAPVAGRYFFITEIQTYGIGGGSLSVVTFKKNGSFYVDSSGGTPRTIVNKAGDSTFHNTIVLSMVIDLAAGDYTSVHTENSRGMQSHFSGYLIG